MTKLYRWKAYNPDGLWRVYRSKSAAKKFATDEGVVVDLYA